MQGASDPTGRSPLVLVVAGLLLALSVLGGFALISFRDSPPLFDLPEVPAGDPLAEPCAVLDGSPVVGGADGTTFVSAIGSTCRYELQEGATLTVTIDAPLSTLEAIFAHPDCSPLADERARGCSFDRNTSEGLYDDPDLGRPGSTVVVELLGDGDEVPSGSVRVSRRRLTAEEVGAVADALVEFPDHEG